MAESRLNYGRLNVNFGLAASAAVVRPGQSSRSCIHDLPKELCVARSKVNASGLRTYRRRSCGVMVGLVEE